VRSSAASIRTRVSLHGHFIFKKLETKFLLGNDSYEAFVGIAHCGMMNLSTQTLNMLEVRIRSFAVDNSSRRSRTHHF